jgi:sugar phosphate isomerase/epimerase
LQRFESAYNLAVEIGAQHLILHAGFIPKTYPRNVWIDNSLEFWKSFLTNKKDSIEIHLENVYEDDASMIIELLDKINEAMKNKVVSSCLDIGHINANSSKTHKEWITALGHRIKYVHLHNNGGIFDDHWGLWKGTINVKEVLDLLAEHSPESVWMIEARQPDIEKSLDWLKERDYL